MSGDHRKTVISDEKPIMKDIWTCVSYDHCAKKHFRSERRLNLKATALPEPTRRFGMTLA